MREKGGDKMHTARQLSGASFLYVTTKCLLTRMVTNVLPCCPQPLFVSCEAEIATEKASKKEAKSEEKKSKKDSKKDKKSDKKGKEKSSDKKEKVVLSSDAKAFKELLKENGEKFKDTLKYSRKSEYDDTDFCFVTR